MNPYKMNLTNSSGFGVHQKKNSGIPLAASTSPDFTDTRTISSTKTANCKIKFKLF